MRTIEDTSHQKGRGGSTEPLTDLFSAAGIGHQDEMGMKLMKTLKELARLTFPPQSLYSLSPGQQLTSCSQYHLPSFTWLPEKIKKGSASWVFSCHLLFKPSMRFSSKSNKQTNKRCPNLVGSREAKMHSRTAPTTTQHFGSVKTRHRPGIKARGTVAVSKLRHHHTSWQTLHWAKWGHWRHSDMNT